MKTGLRVEFTVLGCCGLGFFRLEALEFVVCGTFPGPGKQKWKRKHLANQYP